MGTPNRTNILLNLKSTFQGITVAGGYNTTVATVETWLRSRDEVKSGECPYIGFALDREELEMQPFGVQYWVAPLIILGYIHDATWTTRSASLNKLIDDIIARLNVDHTRGGYAVSTIITGCETDEGDPDAGPIGAIVVYADVKYCRTTGES